MNKDRARTILLGIDDGATGIQRADAIGAVLDELAETQGFGVVLPPPPPPPEPEHDPIETDVELKGVIEDQDYDARPDWDRWAAKQAAAAVDPPVPTSPPPPPAPEPERERDEARAQRDKAEDKAFDAAADFRKRWHEAATQRDALVRAAQWVVLLSRDDGAMPKALERLGDVIDQVESGGGIVGQKTTDVLRRELWAVLDRMPASDDDLIASVRQLKAERDEAIRQHEKTADVMERARAQRDELLHSARELVKAPDGSHRLQVAGMRLGDVVAKLEEDRA